MPYNQNRGEKVLCDGNNSRHPLLFELSVSYFGCGTNRVRMKKIWEHCIVCQFEIAIAWASSSYGFIDKHDFARFKDLVGLFQM